MGSHLYYSPLGEPGVPVPERLSHPQAFQIAAPVRTRLQLPVSRPFQLHMKPSLHKNGALLSALTSPTFLSQRILERPSLRADNANRPVKVVPVPFPGKKRLRLAWMSPGCPSGMTLKRRYRTTLTANQCRRANSFPQSSREHSKKGKVLRTEPWPLSTVLPVLSAPTIPCPACVMMHNDSPVSDLRT